MLSMQLVILDEITSDVDDLEADVTEVTTARTLGLTDAGKFIYFTSASATTVTVPPNSSVAFSTGTEINIIAYGTGTVTIAEGSGVTIKSTNDYLDIAGQYLGATLRKVNTDEWILLGAIA